MKRFFLIAVLFALAAPGSPATGRQRIALKVSPIAALEPAVLTVRATVEPSDDNRKLTVTLDSDGYTMGSDIPLEGKNSSRLSVLELRDVPSGLYEVRAVLSGTSGPIAASMQVVKIQPAPGGRR